MATFYSPAEVIGMAVQTEKSGHEYYEASAKAATSPKVRELFEFLAGEETKHEKLFARLQKKVSETPAQLPYDWENVREYLKVISDSRFFLGGDKGIALARSAHNEQEALDFALQFEKETLLFYLEARSLVSEQHRSVVDEIARQERLHIRKLSELHAR